MRLFRRSAMALFHEPPCVARPSRLPSSTMDSGDGLLAITLRISPAGRGRRLRSSLSNASDVGGAAGVLSEPGEACVGDAYQSTILGDHVGLQEAAPCAVERSTARLAAAEQTELRPGQSERVQLAAVVRNCAAAAGKPASATGVLMGSADLAGPGLVRQTPAVRSPARDRQAR